MRSFVPYLLLPLFAFAAPIVTTLVDSLTSTPSQTQAVINRNGESIVLWEYFNGVSYGVFSSVYDGVTWTNKTVVPFGGDFIGDAVNVALNDSGVALASWSRHNSMTNHYETWISTYDGATWSGDTLVASNNDNPFESPVPNQLGFNDDGQAIYIWQDTGAIKANVNSGSGWQGEIVISTGTNNSNPAVALNQNGLAVVVWEYYDSMINREQVAYATYDFGNNTWSSASPIPATYDRFDPVIAINNLGHFAAAWRSNMMNVNGTEGAFYDGSWTISSQSPAYTNTPQVSINDSDFAIVVWQYVPSQPSLTEIMTYDGGWTAPIDISYNMNSINSPNIALNDSGNACAIWNQDYLTSTHFRPHSIRYTTYINGTWLPVSVSDGTFALTPEMNPYVAGRSFEPPGVDLSNSGYVVMSWILYDGASYSVQAATDFVASAPQSPTNGHGSQKRNVFPFQTQHFNAIEWSASPSSYTAGYNIYRDGSFLTSTTGLQYADNAIQIGKTYTYEIGAFDSNGNQSPVISITVSP